MRNVLSLQMLPVTGMADACGDSGVSCASDVSCRSDTSCASFSSDFGQTQLAVD